MSNVSEGLADVLGAVEEERTNQDLKWGTNFPDRRDTFWLAILAEEVGEAAAEALELEWMHTAEAKAEALDRLYVEVIQCAAVAVSWAQAIRSVKGGAA